jgi:hypothetical protein
MTNLVSRTDNRRWKECRRRERAVILRSTFAILAMACHLPVDVSYNGNHTDLCSQRIPRP